MESERCASCCFSTDMFLFLLVLSAVDGAPVFINWEPQGGASRVRMAMALLMPQLVAAVCWAWAWLCH